MNIYSEFIQHQKNQRKLLAILVDPDKVFLKNIPDLVNNIAQTKADYIFVGGSFLSQGHFKKVVKKLRKYSRLPIIIFPGNTAQISKNADAILLLSLISGRNAEYLIGKQVEAAPKLYHSKLETIATGYILIENGRTTTVEYITNSKPIPRNKSDLAVATALAGQMLGLQLIYLEAGSGARKRVPLSMITKVKKTIQVPLIVGGGIKNKKQVLQAWNAGADLVVVGTAFENNKFA